MKEALTVVIVCRLSIASSIVVVVVVVVGCVRGQILRHTSMLKKPGSCPVPQLSMPFADTNTMQQTVCIVTSFDIPGNT